MFLLLFPDGTSSLATSSVILLNKVLRKELDKAAIIFSGEVIAACVAAINRRNKALKEFLFIS
jgi:hypothetical protein